jgi:hypothetical protein
MTGGAQAKVNGGVGMCAEKEAIAETKIDRLIRALDRLSAALEANAAQPKQFMPLLPVEIAETLPPVYRPGGGG